MNIEELIKSAKIGRARKDAQVDTCAVFAAALYDLLSAAMACKMVTVVNRGVLPWAHSVVEVDGRYYDSLGEFSTPIYRVRAKIHPSVTLNLRYQADSREECYEPEFAEMYAFYLKELTKSFRRITAS